MEEEEKLRNVCYVVLSSLLKHTKKRRSCMRRYIDDASLMLFFYQRNQPHLFFFLYFVSSLSFSREGIQERSACSNGNIETNKNEGIHSYRKNRRKKETKARNVNPNLVFPSHPCFCFWFLFYTSIKKNLFRPPPTSMQKEQEDTFDFVDVLDRTLESRERNQGPTPSEKNE